MIINHAERAHNHNWELDPVIRSLLDTDFYKLLMLQFIWKHFPKTRVTFSLYNRHPAVRMADIVHVEELKVQLQHVRGRRFRKSEVGLAIRVGFEVQNRIVFCRNFLVVSLVIKERY